MSNSDIPNINVVSLREDVYRLVCMLLADEKVSAQPLFQEAAADIHEKEVNRLLIWIAIAARQLLEIDQTDEEQSCGILWNDFPDGTKETLTFRKACDKIIHANEIIAYPIPYDPIPDESSVTTGESPLRHYAGTITIRTTASKRYKASRCELDFETFAGYCFRIAERFTEEH